MTIAILIPTFKLYSLRNAINFNCLNVFIQMTANYRLGISIIFIAYTCTLYCGTKQYKCLDNVYMTFILSF